MKVKVQKWGNSLALRIPKTFARETELSQGSVVDLSVQEGKLVVEPVRSPAYTLDELLEGVTKKNLHGEADTGDAAGREVG